ncbi:uncharacterized protein LOC121383017 [Gigantopelta aegis]|uniref:uncharacterized protein LOC121383017 n=1 Tax=Gigantopelta aegis TaxID=1735272 RepID=UPI001B8896E3|nr:uncharacterized protein LOC121383017 [Gigantopelta aegis]
MPDGDCAPDSADSGDDKDSGQVPESSCLTKSDSNDGDSQQECSDSEFTERQQQQETINTLQQNDCDAACTDRDKIETVKQNFRKRKKLEDCVSQLKEDCLSLSQMQRSSGHGQHRPAASLEQCLQAQTDGAGDSSPYDFVKIKTEPNDHSELQFCYDQDVIGQNLTSDYHSNFGYSNRGIHRYPGNSEMFGRNKRKRSVTSMCKVNLKDDSGKEDDEVHKFRTCQRQKAKRLKLFQHETSDPELLSVLEERRKMFEHNYKSTDQQCSKMLKFSLRNSGIDSTSHGNHNKIYGASAVCSENVPGESAEDPESLVDVKEEMDSFFSSHLSDFGDMCSRSSDDSEYEQDDIGDEWLPSSGQKRNFRKQQKSTKYTCNSGNRTRLKQKSTLSEEIRRQKNTEYRRKRRQELRLSNPEKLQEEREKDRARKQMLRKRNQLLLSLPPDLLSEAAGLAGNSSILDDDGNSLSVPFPFSPGDNIEDLKEKEEQRRATNRDRMRMKRMQMDAPIKEKIKIVSREKMRQRRAQLRESDPVAAALERERQKLKKREERKRNAILLSLPDETLKEAANNTEILQAAIASLTEGAKGNSPLTQLPLDSETAANLAKLRNHLEMKRAEAAERVRRKRAELREKDPEQAAVIREREKIRKRLERRRNTLLLSLPPDELVRVTVASINEGDNVPFQLPSLLALSSSGQVNPANLSGHLAATSAESSDPSTSPAVPHLTEELVKMREKLERKRALDRERMRQRRAKLKENPEAAAAFKEKERLRKQMERWKKSMGLFDSTKPLDAPSLDPSLFVAGAVSSNISGKEVADSSFVNKSLLSMFSLGGPDLCSPPLEHSGRCTKVSQGQSPADPHNSVLSNSLSSLNMSGSSSVDSNFSVSSVNRSDQNVKSPGFDDVQKQNGEHTKTVPPLHFNDPHNANKTALSPEEVDKFPKGFDSNEEQDIQMDVASNKQHEVYGTNFTHSVAQLVSPNVMRIVPSLFEDGAPTDNSFTTAAQSSSANHLDNDSAASDQDTLHNERQSALVKSELNNSDATAPDSADEIVSKSSLQDVMCETAASTACLQDPSTVKRAQEWFIYQLSILQNKMGDRFLQLDPNPKHLDPLPGGIAAQLSPMQLLLVQQLIGPMPVLSDQSVANQVLDPHAFEMKLTEMMIKGYEYREQNRTRARNYRDRLKHDPDYKEKYEQKKLRDLERKRIHRARESELRRLYPEYDEARRLQQRQRRTRIKGKKKKKNEDSEDSQSENDMLQFEMSQSMMDGTNDPLVQDLNRVTSDILSVYSKLDGDQNRSKLSTDKVASGYNLRDVSSAKKLKFVYDENYDDSLDSEPNKSTNLSKSKAADGKLPYRDFENSSDSDDDDDSLSDDDESSTVLDASQ